MSCRRRDSRNLVGCDIGDVAVGGCSRGCCPYSDDEKFDRTHHRISTAPSTLAEQPFEQSPEEQELYRKQGRTNLRWKSCGAASYRPKFICIQCRRMFKPFYDDDANEYSITRFGWQVRPNPAKAENKDLRTAIANSRNFWKRNKQERLAELVERYNIDHEPPLYHRQPQTIKDEVRELKPLNQAELDELKFMEPEAWWVNLIGLGNDHQKRCPGCGEAGIRVGAKFETPSRSDEKGWKEVEQKIQAGDDMMADFEVCATLEDYQEMIVEAERLKRLNSNHEDWEQEKKRRQAKLGLMGLMGTPCS